MLSVALAGAGAQETTGSISGTVTDPTGAAISGAEVKLINTDRGQTIRTLTTNAAGFYTAPALPLGTYTVEVSRGSFRTVDVKGLVLHVSDALTVNRSLQPGGASETVTVEADPVQLNFDDATSQGLINSTQINENAAG